MRKAFKTLACIFLFFLTRLSTVQAANFVVTSNADSGPGTLRQAILDANANGTTVLDYISFNLPFLTISDRTITLDSGLPDLSSEIIIDGSTQPGTKLGVSDAKVIIQMTQSNDLRQYVFVLNNCTHIEFYGLKIADEMVHTQYQESSVMSI